MSFKLHDHAALNHGYAATLHKAQSAPVEREGGRENTKDLSKDRDLAWNRISGHEIPLACSRRFW